MAYPYIDSLTGAYISWRGELLKAKDPRCAALFQPCSERMYYEVIRIVDGVPLFWEDHLERLRGSVAGSFPLPPNLLQESRELIAACGLPAANLRLVLTAAGQVIHLSPSYYPDAATRCRGVLTGILRWEREDPNTKIVHAGYKAAVAARFAAPGPLGPYFELLLEDSLGYLTEGSRSNLFFLVEEEGEVAVLSAPDRKILKGITRKYVLQAIAAAGVRLKEGMLKFSDLAEGRAQAAFITGSPIDILAVHAIESMRLDSAQNLVLRKIDAAYSRIVTSYIAGMKAKSKT